MAEQLYGLTKADLGLLMEMIQERKNRLQQVNTQNRAGDQSVDHQEVFAPETYVAFTPVGGIPAMVGTGAVPGFADCNIYRVIGGVLEQVTFLVRTVYNLSESAVDGLSWVVVVRDKFGTWVAIPTAVGGTFNLTVEETPGTAAVFHNITTLAFDTSAGFTVSQPSAGIAEIGLTSAVSLTGTNVTLATGYTATNAYVSIGSNFPFQLGAGRYLFIAQVSGAIQSANLGLTLNARLYNATQSVVLGSDTIVAITRIANIAAYGSVCLVAIADVNQNDQITIQAGWFTTGFGTPTSATVYPANGGSAATGTILSYVKIG